MNKAHSTRGGGGRGAGGGSFNIHTRPFHLLSVIMRPASDDKSTDQNTPKGPLRSSYLARRRWQRRRIARGAAAASLGRDCGRTLHLEVGHKGQERRVTSSWSEHKGRGDRDTRRHLATAGDGRASAPGPFSGERCKTTDKNPLWLS